MLAGADLGQWQGSPGGWQADAGDISWAAVRLSEVHVDGSHHVDPDAPADWEFLKQASLGRIACLQAHPGSGADDAANMFMAVAGRAGLEAGDGIAVRLETTDGRNPAQVSLWLRLVTRQLQTKLNRDPLIYTDLAIAQAGACAGLGNLPLWVNDPESPAGRPRVPAPWQSWTIHQVEVGPVCYGVADFADLGVFRKALGRKGAAGSVQDHAQRWIGEHLGRLGGDGPAVTGEIAQLMRRIATQAYTEGFRRGKGET